MTRPTVGALIIARDEEHNLAACLETITFCDEIAITVDDRSVDATEEIARRATAKVLRHRLEHLPQQRSLTLDQLTTDWVWVIDADERVTPELREEILRVIADPGDAVAFWVPRRNIILGKWIRHAGWYPDYQLRLWRRGKAAYDHRYQAHERMLIDGPVGYLEQPFIHYNYQRVGQLFTKQDFYAGLEARTLAGQGIRARPQHFVLQPLREFYRRYIRWQGYKDGLHGLFLSLVMAWFAFRVHWKLLALDGMEWTFGPARQRARPVPGPIVSPEERS